MKEMIIQLTSEQIGFVDDYLDKTGHLAPYDFQQILKAHFGDLSHDKKQKRYFLLTEITKVIEGVPPNAKYVRISKIGKDVIKLGGWQNYILNEKSLETSLDKERKQKNKIFGWTIVSIAGQLIIASLTCYFIFTSSCFDELQYNLNKKIYDESKDSLYVSHDLQILLSGLEQNIKEQQLLIDSLYQNLQALKDSLKNRKD